MKKFKCALTSDNHLGYSKNTFKILEKFFKKLAKENIDVLFIAGDSIASQQEDFERYFELVRKFLPNVIIYFVNGNHDRWDKTPPKMPWDDYPGLPVNYHLFYKTRDRLPVYRRPKSFEETTLDHEEVYKKHNIIALDGTSHNLSENIVIMGFDGWYHETNLRILSTNDYAYMPEKIGSEPMHVYLRNKAEKDLERLLYTPTENKTVVMMTHFPPFSARHYERWSANPKFLNFITEKCDFLLVGHSHRQCNFIKDGCRVINAGIDESIKPERERYDKPRYVIFELED